MPQQLLAFNLLSNTDTINKLHREFTLIKPGKIAALSLACFVFCTAVSAHALFYEFNTVISGATPGGPTPWLTAEFTDTTRTINKTTTNGVLLKLQAPHLITTNTNQEFVTNWYFNNTLDDTIDNLKFLSVLNGTAFAKKNYYPVDVNGLNAGAGAKFDVYFQFQTSNNNSNRFENGDVAEIFMYGVTGLTAETFNALSTGNSANKHYFAEAHIQGISTGEGSSWVAPVPVAPVPEPGTIVLLGTGLLGLAIYGKRRRNKQ